VKGFVAIEPAVLLRRAVLLTVFVLVSCFKQPDSTSAGKAAAPTPSDTTPPTAPAALSATPTGAAQMNLSWSPSTDNVAVTLYLIERCQGAGCANFAEIASTPNAAWNDLGVVPSTSYSYRIRARDAIDNLGDYSATATATTLTIGVAVTPRGAGMTLGHSMTLTATVTNDIGAAGVTWSVNGGSQVLGSQNTTSATFSSVAAGSYTVTATSIADPSRTASTTIGVTDLAGVFTNRNDAQRTGQNQQERALTLANVNSTSFGKLFGCPVDAPIYGQPLYVTNLQIGGGAHNTLFVATMMNTVYAFDADDPACNVRWQVSLLGAGETPVPIIDTDPLHPNAGDNDLQGGPNGPVGVMSTPVIDPATSTLYVVSKTKKSSSEYHQRLHALSLLDGSDQMSGPAEISAAITVPGNADTGDGTTCTASAGNVPFCALHQSQRPGLLLANGKIYITWASHDDVEPFHGWVMGFQASDLSQAPVVFNSTPNSQAYEQTDAKGNLLQGEFPGITHAMGGIWQAGTGPAADLDGFVYFGTGNGAFDIPSLGVSYGDSFLKLTPTLSVPSTCGLAGESCFFTPVNELTYRIQDSDLDSGGLMVLPDSVGDPNGADHLRRHLMIGGDKKGILYLLDRDDLGMYNNRVGGGNDSLQEIQLQSIPGGCGATAFCGVFSTPSFWQGSIYVIAVNDVLKRLPIATAAIDVASTAHANDVFKFPGAQTAISSNGPSDGIVWALATDNNGAHNKLLLPTILYAYNAFDLTQLYSSPTSGAGAAGNAVKFAIPTVANGKVYVGTHDEVSVFGLLP
jgi:hypothetical protein